MEPDLCLASAIPIHQVITAVVHGIAATRVEQRTCYSGKAGFVDIIVAHILELFADIERRRIRNNFMDCDHLKLGQLIGAGLESGQFNQGSGFGHPMETIQSLGLSGMIVAQVILGIVKGGIRVHDLKDILPSLG